MPYGYKFDVDHSIFWHLRKGENPPSVTGGMFQKGVLLIIIKNCHAFTYTTCQIHITEEVGNSLWKLEVLFAQKYFTKIGSSDVSFLPYYYFFYK